LETNPVLLDLGIIIAGIVAILGPLLVLIGFITTAFAAVSAPVLAVVAAIGALIAVGAVVIAKWTQVKEFLIKLWESPLGKFFKFFHPVGRLIWLAEKIMEHWKPIKEFFADIWDSIAPTIQKLSGIAGKAFRFVTGGAFDVFGGDGAATATQVSPLPLSGGSGSRTANVQNQTSVNMNIQSNANPEEIKQKVKEGVEEANSSQLRQTKLALAGGAF